jgi:hypothetical protein
MRCARGAAWLLFVISIGCGSEQKSSDLFGDDGAGADGTGGDGGGTSSDGGDDGDDGGDGGDGTRLDVDDGGEGPKYDVGGGGPPITCDESMDAHSYTGCEFWATITYNYVWQDHFSFAVTVANASDQPANVEVTRAGALVDSATIPADDLAVIELPWIPELKGSQFLEQTQFTYDAVNVLVPDGAYKITSDRPVTVYQFNALRYETLPKPASCPDQLHPGRCLSYSNDASLLFPTSALLANYVVMGWKNDAYSDFMSITATEDSTEVRIISSASADAMGWVNPLTKDVESTVLLDAGDVAAFVTNYGTGADFSGTFVMADKPIQVISGVPCVNIPDTDTQACDHIEESVLPVEAFGDDYIVVPPIAPNASVHTVRILGILDGTTLQFDPPAVHPETTIGQGETLEIANVSTGFRVWSQDAAFGVSTYMHGYTQTGAGDPSQSIGVPTAQFKTGYVFLAPEDYDINHVTVVAPTGATITLDGQPVPAGSFEPVGSSGLGASDQVLAATGAHRIEGDEPFGITVYGYGDYTSYMYPGGLGLDAITPPPPPPEG